MYIIDLHGSKVTVTKHYAIKGICHIASRLLNLATRRRSQLQDPSVLPFGLQAGWAPDPVCMVWRREKVPLRLHC